MKVASGKAEYRRSAAAMEIVIRCGVWQERLPNIQTLMKIYNIAKQPVTRALKVLQDNKIITFKGRSGMLINQAALTGGTIGLIVGNTHSEDIFQSVKGCWNLILKCGFQPVMVQGCNFSDSQFWQNICGQFDGLIFEPGMLPKEPVLNSLREKNIPFVATQILPFYPELDYVNFDTENAVRTLTGDLCRAGYKRIALHLSGYSDGYNDKLKTMWLKIKKQLGLELLSCDRVRYHDGWKWDKNAAIFLKSLQKMSEKPEVLIHYGQLSNELRELYKAHCPGYPWNIKIVSMKDKWHDCGFFPDETVFRSADVSCLLTAAFPVLLEKMRNPPACPIHRLIPYNIEYITNPPEIRK